jgi:SSS family solute:Na+ symporter
MTGVTVYGVFAYVALLFLLSGVFLRKVINSFEEYSLCGRSLTIFFIFSTYLGTWIGGGTIIGLSSWAYSSGVSRYWVFSVPYFFGFFFALLFVRRLRRLDTPSLTDLFARRFPEYGGIVRIPVAVTILIRNVTMIGMQFSALSYFVMYSFGIGRNLAILSIFIVVTSYTCLCGLWGVVMTDVLQGALQTAGLLLLFFYSMKMGGGLPQILRFYEGAGNGHFLSLLSGADWWEQVGRFLIPIGLFFLIGDQGDWQRVISSRNDKTAFWGYILPLTVALLWLLLPAYTGVFQRVRLISEGEAEFITYRFIFELLTPPMGVFILICLMAAIMSSADSFLLASGFTFANDIVRSFINPGASDRELIFWNRFFGLVAGSFGFAFAILVENIVDLWILGITVSNCVLFVPYLAAWFSRRVTTLAVLVSMGFSFLRFLAFLFMGSGDLIRFMWIGVLTDTAIVFLVTLLSQRSGKPARAVSLFRSSSPGKEPSE